MADYYTQGSFIFKLNNIEQAFAMSVVDCLQDEDIDLTKAHKTVAAKAYDHEVYRTAKKLAKLIDDYNEFRECCLGFDVAQNNNGLWISNWDSLNGYNAANFIWLMLKYFDKDDIVCFEIAITCSKLRLDSFGGQAWCVSKKGVQYMDTSAWLHKQVMRKQRSQQAAA